MPNLQETLSSETAFSKAVKGLLESNRSEKAVKKFIPDVETFKQLWQLAADSGVDDNAMNGIVCCSRERLTKLKHVPVYPTQKLAERLQARL